MTLYFLLACTLCLFALWGPGHHLEYAERVWRRRREMLLSRHARLLGDEKAAYFYGNLAADIINLKAFGGHYNHCHRWTIIDEMRERASTSTQEAFILGYLSHLAADTIAHNHFVPYHLARFARTKGFGHLYWEMSADRYVPEKRWAVVTQLKDASELDQLDDLINSSVPKKALSMGANKMIFNHVLLISERRHWRRGVERIQPITKVNLTKGFLSIFQKAAVTRIQLALRPKGMTKLLHVDTNGKAAQKAAVQMRRRLIAEYPPGEERDRMAQEMAAPFLEGMQSPPPDHAHDVSPHWNT